MKLTDIHYLSEIPTYYADALDAAHTRDELFNVLTAYAPLALDAVAAAPNNDDEFKRFRIGLEYERRGEFAGNEWAKRYGAILMPELMLRVGMVAQKFMVPWGCAYIRLRDVGHITETNGVAVWNDKA